MRFKFLRFFLKAGALFVLVYYVPSFCLAKTDHFAVKNIFSNLPESSKSRQEEVAELQKIFSKPFTYLTSGGQAYVFLSEDGQFVLKFFKNYQHLFHLFLHKLPLPSFWASKVEKKIKRAQRKIEADFKSYQLAEKCLGNESGIYYAHLNKTSHLHCSLKILDKIGIQHQIDLDQVGFILQKKASLAYGYLADLVKDQKMEQAKQALESLCELILERSNKGIFDGDAKIHRNFGFLGKDPILIDIGCLEYNSSYKNLAVQVGDLEKTVAPLKNYLEKLSPELANYLTEYLKKKHAETLK